MPTDDLKLSDAIKSKCKSSLPYREPTHICLSPEIVDTSE